MLNNLFNSFLSTLSASSTYNYRQREMEIILRNITKLFILYFKYIVLNDDLIAYVIIIIIIFVMGNGTYFFIFKKILWAPAPKNKNHP